jgi:hypothetical protein
MRLLWILVLGACRDEAGGNGGDAAPGESFLTLELPDGAVDAGGPAPYAATVTTPDGTTDVVGLVLRSDLEPTLAHDDDTVTATVVGTHTVTATWQDLEATDTLDVTPGPAAVLDLVLDAASVASGAALGFEVQATDAWGNALDGSAAAVIASSTNVTVGTDSVSASLAGTYDLTAILDGQSDTEPFAVTAGPAVGIELVVSPTALEVGDRATAQVTVEDAAGNPSAAAYTLEVTGVPASIAGDEITFLGEGWLTVTATLADGGGADAVGPILIDSSGPAIEVLEPTRATWAPAWLGDDAMASGTITDAWSDVASAERKGDALALETDGSFEVDDDDAYDWGITVHQITATDSDGNTSTDRRSALYGYYLGPTAGAGSGLRVRLDDGPGGIDVLEELGADLVPPEALGTMIDNPVYENSSLLYSVSLDVIDPAFASSSLDLDCTSGGIDTTFTILDASLEYEATGKVIGIGYSTDGTITMDSIEVTLLATPAVAGGVLRTEVSDLDVSIRGFDFPMASWLEDVLEFFGVDVDEIVQGYVEDSLRDSLEGEIPALMDATLSGFEMAETVSVLGADFAFEAVPNDVLFDAGGLTLLLETTFDGGALTTPHPTMGSLIGTWDDPDWPSSGAAVGVGADLVNQILHGVWGHELLHAESPLADAGIDPAALAVVLPGVKDPILVFDPVLPPVVAPVAVTGGTEQFTFQMGDARVAIYDGAVDDDHLVLDSYLALEADLAVEVGPDLTLVPSFAVTTVWVDVVEPRVGEETTEGLLEALAPTFLPSMTDFLSGIPLPSLRGFALEDVTVETSADGGYAVLGGALVAE